MPLSPDDTRNIEVLIEPVPIKRAILSFSGWPDAGKIIHHTLKELTRSLHPRMAARWDIDGFYHTGSSRPHVSIHHGQIQKFDWPAYRFLLAVLPSSETILLGSGPEPGCRWRAFTQGLLHFLKSWGSEEIVLLGSLYDQILHDEVLISSVVQDARGFNVARKIGCQMIEYEGPAAVHSAIMESARDMGISCMSIWAHLPFYLDGPHELIVAHCLEVLGNLLAIQLDVKHLLASWHQREKEIQKMVQDDLELRRMLESIRDQKESLRSKPDASKEKVVSLEEFARKRNDPTETFE